MVSVSCSWNEKMKFVARSDGHEIEMDAKSPLGHDSAMTPKELLLSGVTGCTGMDVVALLKKYQQTVEEFSIQADADLIEGSHPAIFSKIQLTFKLKGKIDSEKAIEAVHLSQSKYCSVSAMISKAVPIYYTIEVNGTEIGYGQSNFNI